MRRFAIITLALLGFTGSAAAAHPRPQLPPGSHKRIHWVSYTFEQPGHDQYGNHYTRLCHVPAHGKRWCGPWRILFDRHVQRSILPYVR